MGEAKRRGTKEERVNKAITKIAINNKDKVLDAKIRLSEHLSQLELRRLQVEQTLGPLDKLYAQQHKMLHDLTIDMEKRDTANKLSLVDKMLISLQNQAPVVVPNNTTYRSTTDELAYTKVGDNWVSENES